MFRSLAQSVARANVRSFSCHSNAPVQAISIGAKPEGLLNKAWEAMKADGSKGTVTIADNVKAGKFTVLVTYPLDFTYVCPSELIAFSDAVPKFEALNTKVVAASVDSVYSHLAWREQPRKKGGLGTENNIDIISDLNKELGAVLGCLLPGGIHTRATIIINDKGEVVHMAQNHPSVGRSTDEVLRLVEAFQHVAKFGEVCPANFKKGDKAMKPSSEGLKEYFKDI